jgi:hypothetical protein
MNNRRKGSKGRSYKEGSRSSHKIQRRKKKYYSQRI